MENEITVSKVEKIDNTIKNVLFGKVGQGLYINKREFNRSSKSYMYYIGAHCPQLIEDSKKGKRTIKFLDFPDIFSLTAIEDNNKWKLNFPSRDEIADRIGKQKSNLVFKVEQSLLKVSYSDLVNIPMIQNSINPVSEILNVLYQRNKLDKIILNEIEKTRGTERTKKYLNLLESLELVRMNEEQKTYTFGNKFIQIEKTLEKDDRRDLFKQMLSLVIKEGYQYLVEYLNLTSITPYLRWCNTYYFPSKQAGDLLHMTRNDIYACYRNIYPTYARPQRIKFENHLNQIIGVDLIQEEDEYLIGNEKVFQKL